MVFSTPPRQPRKNASSSSASPLRVCTVSRAFALVVFFGCVMMYLNSSLLMKKDLSYASLIDLPSSPTSTSASTNKNSERSLVGSGKQQRATLNANADSAIQPFDLSVNHLQAIPFWNGNLVDPKLQQQQSGSMIATKEDFLPIVLPSQIDLRWRLQATPGAKRGSDSAKNPMQGISAYQIIAERAHTPNTLVWDSGKVTVSSEHPPPRHVDWDLKEAPLSPGSVIRWKVLLWDALGQGPTTSAYSKFGVGPSKWTAKWITHPSDYQNLETLQSRSFKPKHQIPNTPQMCNLWQQRQPLPVARVQFSTPTREISSAMLFMSGLGMFSATLNGKRLTSASVHDPPLTDFSQRVAYRGFDVTNELLLTKNKQNMLAVTLASGWWDGRPIRGALVFMGFMATGSVTTIAELHVTYKDGSSEVLIPTGGDDETGGWKMGKGYLKSSNLFTGETIDLVSWERKQGWDTPTTTGNNNDIKWVTPQIYKAGMTNEEWRNHLDTFGTTRVDQDVTPLAPIGKLIPNEMPPVLPVERYPAQSTTHLGNGRWLLDFGRGMSGVVRFEKGLPMPFKPSDGKYPRGHDLSMIMDDPEDEYITVIHGDSLEMSTGDINLALVAGFGHHAGGERGVSKAKNVNQRGGPCFPKEDLLNYQALTQRDVYLVPKQNASTTNSSAGFFTKARQPRFTVHGFRYAEVCCTKEPPTDAYAIQYRTAFPRWGEFSSSNVILNGAYEMTHNALESNMLGLQSDCPHRERLQYGGDLVAVSPSAMHMFDLSAFYGKLVGDWMESQFSNGAYGVTSMFMDLLPDQSLPKRGSGETIWAAAAPIVTARHMQHYGDGKFALRTLKHHVEWLDFLNKYWEEGDVAKFGNDPSAPHRKRAHASSAALGDWYSLLGNDHWLSHHVYYMASARVVAYLASQIVKSPSDFNLGSDSDALRKYRNLVTSSLNKTKELEREILSAYSSDTFTYAGSRDDSLLGQHIGLFARIVDGKRRCDVLKDMLATTGVGRPRVWPGDEEQLFFKHLNQGDFDALKRDGFLQQEKAKTFSLYMPRYAIAFGIFGIRFSLKTLSEMGFHSLALTKASNNHFPGYGQMLGFNATTLWETWWRSEDMYSRNHPMLGAVADWLSTAVAGVSLSPTTIGGEELVIWPRIPDTVESAAIVHYASATQGTKLGDASVAWKIVDNSGGNDNNVQVVIRVLIPPGSTAALQLPHSVSQHQVRVTAAAMLPDFDRAKTTAKLACENRRKRRQGFPFHWEYDSSKETWRRVDKKKTIGTPCESFLFQVPTDIVWEPVSGGAMDLRLVGGFYEVVMDKWELKPDLPVVPGYQQYSDSLGPFCSDPEAFEWDVDDAEHLI